MRTREELETRLMNELNHWFTRQCQDIYSDFYLYYLPSTANHDGGILIAEHKPANPEYRLAMPEKIEKHSTPEQNFRRINNSVLGRLPVMSWQS